MIEITKDKVMNWQSAIRGMRNPLNSWDKSDSMFEMYDDSDNDVVYYEDCLGNEHKTTDRKIVSAYEHGCNEIIGANDLELMKKLARAGSDHSKFMRMIVVSFDIVAPLYWWKELDTYKVGTVRNSCSTMHKIHDKEFTTDDFSADNVTDNGNSLITWVVCILNSIRESYLKTKDKAIWYNMIAMLPSSYNQKSTITLNYAVLRNIYHSRKNHKLTEWHMFCDWIETLPCSELITEDFKND